MRQHYSILEPGTESARQKAGKVEKQNKWFLPLRMGWGFAWVQEMEADVGPRLHASFVTTNVGRQTQSLPTYGWGYAWSDRADLTLRLVD